MSYEEMITCPICLENFKKPRYLPCLHTYCEVCLSDYISTVYSKEKDGFACPTCRAFYQFHISEDKSLKQAAAEFPVNHLIMTLLDKKDIEQKKIVCYSCLKRGKNEPGQFWCYSCSAALCTACGEFHTSFPALTDHRMAPLDDTKDATSLLSTAHQICEIHPDKKLEMFCEDHDVACCATCTMVNHRKCETVLTLQDAAKGCKETKDANHIDNEIKMLIENIDSKIDFFTKDYEKLEKSSNNLSEHLQYYSENLIKHIDKLKSEFDQKLLKEQSKDTKAIQKRKRTLLNMQSMLSNCENILEAAEKKCSKVQLLTLIPKLSKLSGECRSKVDEMKKNPISLDREVLIDKAVEECMKIDKVGKLT
ncbi:E3 ubiquitin-protein ligase TRIM45-like [Saccostrea cucullata]|uniref:E3 ubiquitin-protein ligase TRIM45-like n=1 Tax=Saccostrea cuccullata TaxID=36930 RepID=UPI002ED2F5E8